MRAAVSGVVCGELESKNTKNTVICVFQADVKTQNTDLPPRCSTRLLLSGVTGAVAMIERCAIA